VQRRQHAGDAGDQRGLRDRAAKREVDGVFEKVLLNHEVVLPDSVVCDWQI
jgi:hypothetical protein